MPLKNPGTHISSLLEELTKDFTEEKFYPYISYIRFPKYKSLRSTSKLAFGFPISVLVGKNGTNKSSILHAIYGAPNRSSTGSYWFSTDVDPINAKVGGQPHFVYAYKIPKLSSLQVEVLNTRSGTKKGKDYWEPGPPKLSSGMQRMPKMEPAHKPYRTASRWNSITKPVLFLDFRSEISAYDRAFNYHLKKPSKNIKNARDFIRVRSRPLAKAFKDGAKSFEYRGEERIISNTKLSSSEVEWISYIIGKKYSDIAFMEHTFFDSKSVSVYLKAAGNDYSEALAGSGETAVCSIVHKIYRIEEKALILIDEPEVSLHPGAQRRLIEFLLSIIIFKKHQIVISTHSPPMVEGLPSSSLHLIKRAPDNLIDIFSNISSVEAFVEIESHSEKPQIYCEDITMNSVLDRLKTSKGEDLSDYADFQYISGGADGIKSVFIPINFWMRNENAYFLIDGDKFTADIPDPDTIPAANNATLLEMIKNAIGEKAPWYFNSNTPDEKKYEAYRLFMKYYRKHVIYFPFLNPEQLVIDNFIKGNEEYESALEKSSVKEIIYSAACIHYRTEMVSNMEVEGFIKFTLGRIENLGEILNPIRDFFEERLVNVTTNNN